MDKQYGRIRNQAWNGVRIRYEQDNDDDVYKNFFNRSDSDYQRSLNPNIPDGLRHRKNIIKLLYQL